MLCTCTYLYTVFISEFLHEFSIPWYQSTCYHSHVFMSLSPSTFYLCCFSSQYVVSSGRSGRPSAFCALLPVFPVAIQCIGCFLTSGVTQKHLSLLFWWRGSIVNYITAVPRNYQIREVLGAVHRL